MSSANRSPEDASPEDASPKMVSPLDDVRVIELTSWMAAPSAGAIFADMGADVIKVEPLSGDPMRGMGRPVRVPQDSPVYGIDATFTVDNRGKRSIAVAIDKPEGAALVRRLVADADVLLTNLLPHRQARYGLDAASLHQLTPTLVHATLTGYGMQGPDAQRPGYDVTAFFGRGAITESLIEGDFPPPLARPAQGDHTTGLALVAAVLAALRQRDKTGEGQTVDVSLFATAVWTMASDVVPAILDHKPVRRRDRFHQLSPTANRYRTGDERWLIFNMPEVRYWPLFCKTLGVAELAEDERYDSVKKRYDAMPELTALFDEIFATKPLTEWSGLLDDAGLIWGPAAAIHELPDDEQARAIGLYREVKRDGAASFETLASPINIAGAGIGPRSPAPELGADTSAVLAAAGVTEDELASLRESGIIAR